MSKWNCSQCDNLKAIQECNNLSNRGLAKVLKVNEASIRVWKADKAPIPPYIKLLIECMQKLKRL